MTRGSLTLVIGPMFSGKTTYLIHKAQAASRVDKVLYIVHSLDTRDPSNIISTHNKQLNVNGDFTRLWCSDLSTITNEYINDHNFGTICIDEAQFFENLRDDVIRFVEQLGKDVILGGLSGTSSRTHFGTGALLNIIPLADDVVYLNKSAWCERCARDGIKEHAIFSHRISKNDKNEISIGADNYIPVCRGCFMELNN